MNGSGFRSKLWIIAIALTLIGIGTGEAASVEEPPEQAGEAASVEVSPEKAGEKVGIEGKFVRVATNDEGWVVLGYRLANESAGEEWMLLEVGMTALHGVKEQTVERDDVFLVNTDGKTVPLATQKEFQDANLQSLSARADMIRDSIDYFPGGARRACRIGFFSDVSRPRSGLAHDTVSMNSQSACVGRLYFHVPGGIQYGTYNLDVRFESSTVRVPFRIMTKEEAKEFEKEWKATRKEQKKEKKQAED